MDKPSLQSSPGPSLGRLRFSDPRSEIWHLGREVYGPDFDQFLSTPRRSLGDRSPAQLIEQGQFEAVLRLLAQMYEGSLA
jgi:uncharacterized protein (DUF2384 family)